jgi:N-acyl-D-amino-acid deacylase
VVFDPERIEDRATYDEPDRHPAGIDHVVVNGLVAVRDGALTAERAGRLLRNGARS